MGSRKIVDMERDHLNISEVNSLLSAAKDTPTKYGNNLRDYLLLGMMYRHGLRVSEAVNIKWQDIEFDENRIYLKRSKGSVDGYHPLLHLSQEVTERRLLMELREQNIKINPTSPYVFLTSRGSSITRYGVDKMIKKYAKLAGIKFDVWCHLLRHSCATHMGLKRLPVLEIQTWLGHKSINSSMHYIHKTNTAEVTVRWW